MNGLDLFSGIGGIALGLQDYVRPIAYCEIDPYCQAVLLSRMADNSLPTAPIWDDITTLQPSELRASIDIITAGFPCQDISCAGTRKGLAGERSGLFFEILRLAKKIKPKFIFLENAKGILSNGGIEVIETITSIGYSCRWITKSCKDVGSPQNRERWFCLAYSNNEPSIKTNKKAQSVENKKETWLRPTRQNRRNLSSSYWQTNQPPILGMDDGISYRMDRARTLGNSCVPAQAKEAFEILIGLK